MTPTPTLSRPRGGSDEDILLTMLAIRRFEERVLELCAVDEVSGSVHTCVGQEVAPVAVLASLDARDRILATYRGHGWAIASGVPLDELLGEIMGKAEGVNGGRGGSAYFSAPQYGFVGENSIVGAGLPIANGVAMALQSRGEGGIAVTSFGDGATNQGGSHEALVFAIARRLPVLFVCENNGWSEMTPISATVPSTTLTARVAGYGMDARQVDGTDVAATRAAARDAVEAMRSGSGPVFLEIMVPRMLGHYNADIEHYRSAEDREAHRDRDPIAAFTAAMTASGAVSESRVQELEAEAGQLIDAAESATRDMSEPDPATASLHVWESVELSGWDYAASAPSGKEMKYGIAVNSALERELTERDEMLTFGEDIAIPGGTFGVTRNLRKKFGERVFDTPISEAAILGAAIGASGEGLLPVVEIMWSDFLFVALDQVVNQASNVRYLSRGTRTAPMVIRMQQGATPGSCAQHSQSIEAILGHIPGIRVGMPSTANDAYAMTRAAIAHPDPVVIIEARELYLTSGEVDVAAPVEAVGGARLRTSGADLLIVTWGRMTNAVLEAAESLSAEGIEASVLDLRWISPLDTASLEKALRGTSGRVLIVHEANVSGGFGAEVAAGIAERHSDLVRGPITRLGLGDSRIPASPVLMRALIPGPDQIVDAARALVAAQ